jgi:exoribonuclease R
MKYYEEYNKHSQQNNKYKVIIKNYNKQEIYVENIESNIQYKIPNIKFLNRCFNDDIVYISNIEEEIIQNDYDIMEELYIEYSCDDKIEDMQNNIISENKRVINKVKENNKIYNSSIGGILEINTLKNYGVNKRNIPYFKFRPLDKSYPSFLVASSCKKKYKKNIFCTILYREWTINQLYPYGQIDEIYGEIDNYNSLQNILIKKYELYNKYKLTDNDEDLIYHLDKELKEQRLNNNNNKYKRYLYHDIISIDPEGCLDIDDAFHCIETDDTYIVYIHISDVSEYVKIDSKIDNIAKKNYSTIYNDNNISMLPKVLSNKICSLNTNNDYNLVITTKYTYNKDTLILLNTEAYESIIKVKYNLNYNEAQEILNNKDTDIDTDIDTDTNININIINFQNNIKNSIKILSLISNENDTHKIVEYFMILTNSYICELIYKKLNFTIIRNYKQKESNEINEINEINISKKQDEQFINFTKFLNYYNNESAKYCILSNDNIDDNIDNPKTNYHDLLNLKYYTHFTSPIRRYIDIEVHRLYKLLNKNNIDNMNNIDNIDNIDNINIDTTINYLSKICNLINTTESSIKKYYRELSKIKLIYNETNIQKKIYDGYIIEFKHIIDELFIINIYISGLNIIYSYNLLRNNRNLLLEITKIYNNTYEIKNKINMNNILLKKYDNIKIKISINLLKNDINKYELNIIEPNISELI